MKTLFTKIDSALAIPVENDPDVFSTLDYAQYAGIAHRTAHQRLSELLVKGIVAKAKVCRRENGRLQVKDGWRYIGNSARRQSVGSDRAKAVGSGGGRAAKGRRGGPAGKAVVVASASTGNGGSGRSAALRG